MTTKVVRLKIIYIRLKTTNLNKLMLIFTTLLVFSCQTNPQKIEGFIKETEEPLATSQDIVWLYTKNGVATHKLLSPKVLRFKDQREYMEFPLGLEVFSFNPLGEQEAYMKSDYAIQHLDDKIIEAKGGVFLENSKGEKLETEVLVWDEKLDQIFTEALVKITKHGQLIIGDGFESNTSFSKYTLKNSHGIINLDQEE